MKNRLAVVILTKNEAIHIQRAVENVKDLADKVIVLDSYSTDETADLAKHAGAEVIYRAFDNYKNQRQYAIEYCKSLTEWVLFLDADEYLLDELKVEIQAAITDEQVAGYYLTRRVIVMGRWIKHGGYYPCHLLRLFRPALASIEREINEHVKVKGTVKQLKHDFVDRNLKGMTFWINKHNDFASFEADSLWDALATKQHKSFKKREFFVQSTRKQWIRENIWNHLPLLIKPFIYFFYRYFFRLGFLDGRVGFCYHFLQACWYPFLIDVKYLEQKQRNASA